MPALARCSAEIRSALSFHLSYNHLHTSVGQVIIIGWGLAEPLPLRLDVISCSVQCRIKIILRKTRSLMKPTREEMEDVVGPFRRNMPFQSDHTFLSRQITTVSVPGFSCVHETVIEGKTWESFFSLLHPAIQFAAVERFHDLRHKQYINF